MAQYHPFIQDLFISCPSKQDYLKKLLLLVSHLFQIHILHMVYILFNSVLVTCGGYFLWDV
jgi:hypothetical protein